MVHLGSTGLLLVVAVLACVNPIKFSLPEIWPFVALAVIRLTPYTSPHQYKKMIFVGQYPWCQFLLLLKWLWGAVYGFGGGVCSITAENIYLCNAGVGQCSLPKSKPNQLELHKCWDQDPTRKKKSVFTFGTDLPKVIDYWTIKKWVLNIWTLLAWRNQYLTSERQVWNIWTLLAWRNRNSTQAI